MFPKSVSKTFLSWRGSFVGKRCKKAWMAPPLTLFWTIWRERNIIAFDNREFSAQRMKSLFLYNYWSWINMYMVDRPRSLVDFFPCTLFSPP